MFLLLFSLCNIDFLSLNGNYAVIYHNESPKAFKLKPGKYKFNLYGANGGKGLTEKLEVDGGKGAGASGVLTLQQDTVFYAYIGISGDGSTGGKNGGGNGKEEYLQRGGGGGGATDLRIHNADINSRIIVAAGGSGGIGCANGLPGGNITGIRYNSTAVKIVPYESEGKNLFLLTGLQRVNSTTTTQNSGNPDGQGFTPPGFGSGGGGGYFGGMYDHYQYQYEGENEPFEFYVGQSGSSYISGHPQCTPHSSNVIFENPKFDFEANDGNGFIFINADYQCPSKCADCTSNGCLKCSDGYVLENDECKPLFSPTSEFDGKPEPSQSSSSTKPESFTQSEAVTKTPIPVQTPDASIDFLEFKDDNTTYFGNPEIHKVFRLKQGKYTISLCGAQGGNGVIDSLIGEGGKGALVSGTLTLDQETIFYANVGTEGNGIFGGNNGGGNGYIRVGGAANISGGGGGGATDLRVGTNDTANRIIVAAGGSGGFSSTAGCPGGTTNGICYDRNSNEITCYYFDNTDSYILLMNSKTIASPDTTQSSGGTDGIGCSSPILGSGGGGGYFGGVCDFYSTSCQSSNENLDFNLGQSGSSYVSGHSSAKENISNYIFDDIKMNEDICSNDGFVFIERIYECPSNCKSCNSGVCTDCLDDYRLEDNKCILDKTTEVTIPLQPSTNQQSSAFTTSFSFSNSDHFSKSSMFSKSNVFAETSKFSGSAAFSYSSMFSKSNDFAETSKFSGSAAFSYSSMFSKSNVFAETSKFS